MRVVEHPWDAWRAIIDLLRAKGLPYMREHADRIERELETHAPDEATVAIAMNDDCYLRAYTYARVELGIPLAADHHWP